MNNDTSFDSNPPIETSAYDESIRLFCGAYEAMFTMAYAALRSQIGEGTKVLVVGAGTGMEICTFAPLSPKWTLTGVDPSGDMLAIARRRIETLQLGKCATLFQGYTHDLPEGELHDAATCILVMHFLEDDGAKLHLLQSISQRLRSGAPIVLIDGFGDAATGEFERTLQAWKTFRMATGADQETVEDAFRTRIMKLVRFVPEARILGLLNEAGFDTPARFFTSFLYGGWIATKK